MLGVRHLCARLPLLYYQCSPATDPTYQYMSRNGMQTSPCPTGSPTRLASPVNTPRPAPGIVDGAKNSPHSGCSCLVSALRVALPAETGWNLSSRITTANDATNSSATLRRRTVPPAFLCFVGRSSANEVALGREDGDDDSIFARINLSLVCCVELGNDDDEYGNETFGVAADQGKPLQPDLVLSSAGRSAPWSMIRKHTPLSK